MYVQVLQHNITLSHNVTQHNAICVISCNMYVQVLQHNITLSHNVTQHNAICVISCNMYVQVLHNITLSNVTTM